MCNFCLLVPSSKEVLQKGAAGHEEAFQRVLEEEDGGLQLLGLLLLLLDLGLQGIAEGLGLGENLGWCSFFLALATLTTSSFSEGCMAAAHCILKWRAQLLSHSKAKT